MKPHFLSLSIAAGLLALVAPQLQASSHREALAVAATPQVDNTDVYAFNSYEAGRTGYVTLIANFVPFQDPGGGPNFYPMDNQAIYAINVDNDGDAKADLSFAFEFDSTFKQIALNVGGQMVPIPLVNAAPIGPGALETAGLDRVDTYTVTMTRDGSTKGARLTALSGETIANSFIKPIDNIGLKSIPDYAAYASRHIYSVGIPGCSAGPGRLFVGQRKESFVVNIGEIFDLINLNPLGAPDGKANSLDGKNITSLALEVPAACLTSGNEPVIGVWSTASKLSNTVRSPGLNRDRGSVQQVSRLGMALVNEVVIGVPDKDRFNASLPDADSWFLTYVTNPVLPELIEALFPVTAPNVFPRADLVTVFLTGVPGLNQPANVVPSEMLRLNTTTPTVGAATQNPLGVIAGDNAGYPNGRRPGDDVVDISLRVAMGVLLTPTQAPSGQLPYTDEAYIDANMFDSSFPYLLTPLPGSPAAAVTDDTAP